LSQKVLESGNCFELRSRTASLPAVLPKPLVQWGLIGCIALASSVHTHTLVVSHPVADLMRVQPPTPNSHDFGHESEIQPARCLAHWHLCSGYYGLSPKALLAYSVPRKMVPIRYNGAISRSRVLPVRGKQGVHAPRRSEVVPRLRRDLPAAQRSVSPGRAL